MNTHKRYYILNVGVRGKLQGLKNILQGET